MREYRAANPAYTERARVQRQEWGLQMRRDALDKFGGKCLRCSFSDERALQFDHINADGYLERRDNVHTNGSKYKRLLSDAEYAKSFQLLCANCNWIKRQEQKEYNSRHRESISKKEN
jgi:hypothetical protein